MTHEHNWKYSKDFQYTFMQIWDRWGTNIEKTPYGEWWVCSECGAEQLRFIITEGKIVEAAKENIEKLETRKKELVTRIIE